MKKTKFLVAFLIFLLFIVSTYANGKTDNIILNDKVYIHSVLLNNENPLELLDILGMIEKNEKKIIISDYNIALKNDYKKELENIKDMYFQENYYWNYLKNGDSIDTINMSRNDYNHSSQDKIVTNVKFFKNDYSNIIKSTSLHSYLHNDNFDVYILYSNKVSPNVIEIKPNIFIFS
jgi:uncharacterized protein (DUF2249 family)